MLSNRSVPSSTVIPELVYDDVEAAVGWLCEAFGFTVRWHAGDHRAQLHVGAGAVVVRDRPPDVEPGAPVPGARSSVLVRVEDVDAQHARALAGGARPVRASRPPLRRAPVHGRGPRRPSLDVHAVNRRRRAGGVGRRVGRPLVASARSASSDASLSFVHDRAFSGKLPGAGQ